MASGVDGRRIVVLGATGMIGRLIVRYALSDPAVTSVTSVGRRATGLSHHKLHEVVHADFTDFARVEPELDGISAAFFCMGVYTGTVPDAELRRLTADAPVAFARSLHRVSPTAVFCLLSGQGADQSGRSRMAYARYKGAAESAILALEFKRAHFFRPGYIYPVEPRTEPTTAYRVMRARYPLGRRVYPNVGLSSEDLARAMLHAGLHGTDADTAPEIENRQIRRLADRIRHSNPAVTRGNP